MSQFILIKDQKHDNTSCSLRLNRPYGLSVGEKWANLCGARRWPARNSKTVDRFVSPLSKNIQAVFSTGMLQAAGRSEHLKETGGVVRVKGRDADTLYGFFTFSTPTNLAHCAKSR